MEHRFYETAFSDTVFADQSDQGGAQAYTDFDRGPVYAGEFGEAEVDFITARDSFYLATIAPGGWPYVQHRGGPVGFVEVMDAQTLTFPDYSRNRQCISRGNISAHPRVCIFMMDYERQTRLKILGKASLIEGPSQALRGEAPHDIKRTELHWMIKIEGFDWNCQQYVPRRFSESRVRGAVESLQEQIRALKHKVWTLERTSQATPLEATS